MASAPVVIVAEGDDGVQSGWTYWFSSDMLGELGQGIADTLGGSRGQVVMLAVSGTVLVGGVYVLCGVLGIVGIRAGCSAADELHSFDLAVLLRAGRRGWSGRGVRGQPWPFQADTGSYAA